MKPKYTDSHKYPYGYSRAVETDIRKTFERARQRIKEQQQEVSLKVRNLKERTNGK